MVAGKLLGAMLGFSAGLATSGSVPVALVLTVLGAVVGHRIDLGSELPTTPSDAATAEVTLSAPAPQTREELEQSARSVFAQHVAELFLEVARADGRSLGGIAPQAAVFLQESLGFSPEDVAPLTRGTRVPLKSPEEAGRVCREQLSLPERMLLVDALYGLGKTSAGISRAAQFSISAIAATLGLSAAEHASIASMHLGAPPSHYALLGISRHATDEEVKRAFRQLAKEHHPDKVSHLGNTAVFRASEAFRSIREAYEAVLAEREAERS